MIFRRFSSQVREQNWVTVVLDIFVVVVGLFLGLQFDTWWESQKDARQESVYLQEIREDLELNRDNLQLSTANLEQITSDMLELLEQSRLPAYESPVTQLNQKFSSILNMPTFMPVSRAYANLTGSGDLKLIESRRLKNLLADYYATAKLTELVQNTHELELVHIFAPYIITHLDYGAVGLERLRDFALPAPVEETLIADVLASREFRNVVIQKWDITTDLLSQHRKMLKRTNDLLQLLN
ncbi:MAG TPA: hypothetical protein VKN35_14135 [Xanthomonadales bacterium]|nr:hypothetical protein [Xanthomonadales bacterium]